MTNTKFMPPPPMSMVGYFDQITQNKLGDIGKCSVWTVDDISKIINQRTTIGEQAALYAEMETRFKAYGEQKGYFDDQDSNEKESKAKIVKFVVEDIIGLKKTSAEDHVYNHANALVDELIESILNSRGKKAYSSLKTLYDFLSAKSGEEALKVIAAASTGLAAKWLKTNWPKVVARSLRAFRVPGRLRNRLIKYIAMRIAWAGNVSSKVSSAFARFNPYILFVTIMLESEEIASDAVEEKMTFITIYRRVTEQRDTQFSNYVTHATPKIWQVRRPMSLALEQAQMKTH